MKLIIFSNIGLLVLAGLMCWYMLRENGKSMFFGMETTILVYFWAFYVPSMMVAMNFVLLLFTFPHYFYLAVLPYVVPFFYSIGLQIVQWHDNRTYDKFKMFGDNFKSVAEKYGIDLRSEDIRVQFHDKKRVTYILKVYNAQDEHMVKAQSEKFQRLAQKAFPSYQIKVVPDKQREPRKE